MRKILLAVILVFFLGFDSCSDDYEFCPNCKTTDPTPTPTSSPSPTNTPTQTPEPDMISATDSAQKIGTQNFARSSATILSLENTAESKSTLHNLARDAEFNKNDRYAELKAQIKRALEEYKTLPTPIPVFVFSSNNSELDGE